MKAHIYNPCPPAPGKGALYLGEPTEENKLGDVDPDAGFKVFEKMFIKPLEQHLNEKVNKAIKNGKDIVL